MSEADADRRSVPTPMSPILRVAALVLLSAGTLLVQYLARDRPTAAEPPMPDEQLDIIQACLLGIEELDKDEAAMIATGHLPETDSDVGDLDADLTLDWDRWNALLKGIASRPARSHAVLRAKVALLRRLIARDLVVHDHFTVIADMPGEDQLVLSVLRDVSALLLH